MALVLGYELDDALPDHNVLSKTRQHIGLTVYQPFFRKVEQPSEARGFIQGDILFINASLRQAYASEKTFQVV